MKNMKKTMLFSVGILMACGLFCAIYARVEGVFIPAEVVEKNPDKFARFIEEIRSEDKSKVQSMKIDPLVVPSKSEPSLPQVEPKTPLGWEPELEPPTVPLEVLEEELEQVPKGSETPEEEKQPSMVPEEGALKEIPQLEPSAPEFDEFVAVDFPNSGLFGVSKKSLDGFRKKLSKAADDNQFSDLEIRFGAKASKFNQSIFNGLVALDPELKKRVGSLYFSDITGSYKNKLQRFLAQFNNLKKLELKFEKEIPADLANEFKEGLKDKRLEKIVLKSEYSALQFLENIIAKQDALRDLDIMTKIETINYDVYDEIKSRSSGKRFAKTSISPEDFLKKVPRLQVVGSFLEKVREKCPNLEKLNLNFDGKEKRFPRLIGKSYLNLGGAQRLKKKSYREVLDPMFQSMGYPLTALVFQKAIGGLKQLKELTIIDKVGVFGQPFLDKDERKIVMPLGLKLKKLHLDTVGNFNAEEFAKSLKNQTSLEELYMKTGSNNNCIASDTIKNSIDILQNLKKAQIFCGTNFVWKKGE